MRPTFIFTLFTTSSEEKDNESEFGQTQGLNWIILSYL